MMAGVMALAVLTGCGSEKAPEAAQTGEAAQTETTAVESSEPAVDSNVDEDNVDNEIELVQASLTYMGGLYISDPENDLMFSIFKNEQGDLVSVVTKLDKIYYGILGETPSATLDDGREYTQFTVEDHTFGYFFGDETTDSFVVDEDGTVYFGKDLDESVAREMVTRTLSGN